MPRPDNAQDPPHLISKDLLGVPQSQQEGESVFGVGGWQKGEDARERIGKEHG
jgi:hypothetical protein